MYPYSYNYANPQIQPNTNSQTMIYRPPVVKGRVVTSLDEVRASQIDFDGSLTYFPCLAENCIYTKCIDLNGLPIIQKYVIEQPIPPPQYVTMEVLEQKLAELKGGMKNESNEPLTTDTNAKSKQQPYGYGSTNARK